MVKVTPWYLLTAVVGIEVAPATVLAAAAALASQRDVDRDRGRER